MGNKVNIGIGWWIRWEFFGLEREITIDVRKVRYCTYVEFLKRSVILLKNLSSRMQKLILIQSALLARLRFVIKRERLSN